MACNIYVFDTVKIHEYDKRGEQSHLIECIQRDIERSEESLADIWEEVVKRFPFAQTIMDHKKHVSQNIVEVVAVSWDEIQWYPVGTKPPDDLYATTTNDYPFLMVIYVEEKDHE